ncbi:hypothetical protein BGZ54_008215 [Gamsiella multidivaricata]|nr:hypothetical protein BGZ54_008215 [Gamsiella multidivaricata]
MPPQQRGMTMTHIHPVTILKRSSVAPPATAPSPVQGPSSPSKQTAANATSPNVNPASLQRHQNNQHQHQHQQNHRNHHLNQKPKPQSPQPLSKARRVQRRKEIEATTESLAQADLDQAMHQSPPLDPSSPPSSSDSDDSESPMTRLPDTFLNMKRHQRQLAGSPPLRPNSAPAAPQQQLRHGYLSMDPAQQQQQQRSVYASRVAHPMETMMQRPKASSSDKVLMADRVPVEKKSTLYAGPTFHNSPAPTSLPIPAFARSANNSPAEAAVERLPSAPFFAEAASPQLNSMRPQLVQPFMGGWNGHYSMPMPMPTPMGHAYNVPERMATSSFAPHTHMSTQPGVDQLMEISQNLRTLLKIQSQ